MNTTTHVIVTSSAEILHEYSERYIVIVILCDYSDDWYISLNIVTIAGVTVAGVDCIASF
ncbi:14410_t:CDS:2 [Cetraspora pellucida]|uniref:14410_t:CDS:1 n=1 Tax=Cetraspora pellucida TaxID=1433469 RepID=A0A9N8YV10_9GLOM|nr:14410_t:CDS:2 [Cetraspora pellucida]